MEADPADQVPGFRRRAPVAASGAVPEEQPGRGERLAAGKPVRSASDDGEPGHCGNAAGRRGHLRQGQQPLPDPGGPFLPGGEAAVRSGDLPEAVGAHPVQPHQQKR